MPSAHTFGTIRTVFGIIGDVTSFGLFVSPATTIVRISAKKSVEEFHPFPYLAAAINCAFWVFYAMPFNHPNSWPVLAINSIGLLLELGYISVFFIHSNKKMRLIVAGVLLSEVIFFAAMAVIDLTLFHTHKRRSFFVGFLSVIFGLILYGSPLSVMRNVIKTKNSEFMPFLVCLAGFLNGIIWAIYAIMGQFDPFILVSNGIGAVLGFIQLILWFCYRPSKANRAAKTSEVEMP